MKLILLSRYLFLLVALLLLPSFALAQQASGTVEGIVKDNTGAVIPGADVTLSNSDTGAERTLQTNEAGYYRFPAVEVGRYLLKVNAQGFAPTEQSGLIVQVGKTIALDVVLQVGSVGSEVVTVTAEAPVVETTRTQVSTVVDERSVRDLPVNGRNFQEFVLLTPGVSSDPRGGDISFGGLRGTNNSLQIDGSDNNNTFFGQSLGRTGSGRAPYQFSKDAVREFQVNTNAYSAEYGRAGGAVVNVVTKSGTNDFHGGGFIFFRDRSLNAQEPFAKAAARPEGRNRIYQFGAILSGPIQKDKTFFFFNYDGQRNSEPNAVIFGARPPADAASQAAAQRLASFLGTYDRKFNQDVFLGKVDHQLFSNTRLSVRYNHQDFEGTNLENSGSTSALEHTGNSNVKTDTVTANATTVVTSRLINEARFNFSRDKEPGQANSDNPEAIIRLGAVTVLQIGRNNFSPRETTIKRYQLLDSISYTAGTHALKFGIDINIEKIKNFFPGLFNGSYTFTSFDDFLDGRPSGGYQQAFAGPGTSGARTNPDNFEISFYAQDDWRATSRLKIYYGLRYDYQKIEEPKITNPNFQLANANINTGRVNQDLNNLGPRVGVAYTATSDGKTLVRAGYGVFYSRTPSILTATAISQNGIQVQNLFFPASAAPVYPFRFSAPPSGVTPSRPSLFFYDQDFVQPYVQQGSLGVERELPGGIGVTVSYLVVKGTKLPRVRDINLALAPSIRVPVVGVSGLAFTVPRFVRPLSAFNRLMQVASESNSIYHGLSLQVNKRYSRNFQFLMSYTYSKSIDDKPDATTVVVGVDDFKIVENQLQPALDRGPGESDLKHRFVVSGVYDLNIARVVNSSSSIVKALLGGYSLSGIFTGTSGRTFTATVGGDLNGDGNGRTDRVPGVGRNTLRGPKFYQLDMRLSKSFRPTETTKLEFIVEAFNLLNRTNIATINTNQFLIGGTSTAPTLIPNRTFLQPTTSTGSRNGANRQLQLALKFDF
ncbi:MAG: carboxypeptidase regulatory-like domain-containing protein [Acidobacteriota bacterium]